MKINLKFSNSPLTKSDFECLDFVYNGVEENGWFYLPPNEIEKRGCLEELKNLVKYGYINFDFIKNEGKMTNKGFRKIQEYYN